MRLPEGLPRLPADRRFRSPDVDAFRLPNGLEVLAVPRPGLGLVTLRLVVRGGRADDAPDAPGFSDLMAEALEEGTATRGAEALFDELQAAGGDLSAVATADAVVVTAHGLASKVALFADLLADVVRNAAFPRAGVARVKALSREDLATDESEPSFLAGRAFARAVFGRHPYGTVAPTRASIREVTVERLRRELPRRLQPGRSLLVVSGDLRPRDVRRAVEGPFGEWAGSARPPAALRPASRARRREGIVIVDRPGSVQATLLVGNVGTARTEPDAWPLDLAVTIFGGAFSSRLVQNLRVDKGYTYSPGASSTWLSARGAVRTWASVRTAAAAPALAEIFREMERMGSEPVGPEELERGRRRNAGREVLALETTSGIARELGDLWLSGLGPEWLGDGLRALSRVTAADVEAVSARFLDPSRAAVVAVGDRRKLVEALSSFGPVVQDADRPVRRTRKRER